jgi:hypothetical protein
MVIVFVDSIGARLAVSKLARSMSSRVFERGRELPQVIAAKNNVSTFAVGGDNSLMPDAQDDSCQNECNHEWNHLPTRNH